MTYRAKHVPQADGSPLQWSNCRMAVLATHLDFHTQGKKTSTGAKMRAAQDDQQGGTDADDARRAWERGYGETLVIRNGKYWAKLLDDRAQGRFISLDVWYATLPDRCQTSANFGHTVGIAPEDKDGKWLVSDPLCTGYKWMHPEDLYRASQDWSAHVLGGATTRTGAARTLPQRARATETGVSGGSGTGAHPAETGGAEDVILGLPIYYTTALEDKMDIDVRLPLTPVVLTVPEGTAILNLDGSKRMTSTVERKNVLSPFTSTSDGGTVLRAIVWSAPDPSPDLLLAIYANAAKDVVAVASPSSPDEVIKTRDAQWINHLTPPR